MPSEDVRELFAWPAPEIVVKAFRRFGDYRRLAHGMGMARWKADFDRFNLAQQTIHDDFGSDSESYL